MKTVGEGLELVLTIAESLERECHAGYSIPKARLSRMTSQLVILLNVLSMRAPDAAFDACLVAEEMAEKPAPAKKSKAVRR
jgi:hypothetical protein